MISASRCNVLTYFIFASATQPMSSPNFSVIDELLTKFMEQIGVDRVPNWGIVSSGNITLTFGCNAHSKIIIGSSSDLKSSPNFNVTDELLTKFMGQIGTDGVLK